MSDVAEQLVIAGMHPDEARTKTGLVNRANAALQHMSGTSETSRSAFWVPGRIEFLGKHTDYAGGRSLLCAAERGAYVIAQHRDDARIRICDATIGDPVDLIAEPPSGHWSTYPFTVVQRLARNFPGKSTGVDIAFASDLPQAAGMSSSSVLVVATYLALDSVNSFAIRQEYSRSIHDVADLAGYLGTTENGQSFGNLTGERGVGTSGGSEDHTAILCSHPNSLVQYSFCPVHFEQLATFPKDHVLIIASSGIRAEKTGAALRCYNAVSARAHSVLEQLRTRDGVNYPTLAAAIAASPARKLIDVDPALIARLEQFLIESTEVIPAATEALQHNDLITLGKVVDRSQQAAEQLLGNQVPETIFLAKSARELGAVAASAFGAGFGGSVWALVSEASAEVFSARWSARYNEQFPAAAERAEFFATHAGPRAMLLSPS